MYVWNTMLFKNNIKIFRTYLGNDKQRVQGFECLWEVWGESNEDRPHSETLPVLGRLYWCIFHKLFKKFINVSY